MIKHTNPFYTIQEALAVLKNAGADPDKLDLTPGCACETSWQEDILGIIVRPDHEGLGNYFVVDIQMYNAEGAFDRLKARMPQVEEKILPHSAEFDMRVLEPGSLLRIFTLIPKGSEK